MGRTDERLVAITELNVLPPEEVGQAVRPLFEAAAPLARGLARHRPYASWDELLACSEALLAELSEAEKVEVVNAHPRIGEQPETVKRLSGISYREQGYASEAGQDPEAVARVYAELRELNRAYEARFGFRFVLFVAGRSKAEIVPVLRERLANPRGAEMATALHAMLAIARSRLAALRATEHAPPSP